MKIFLILLFLLIAKTGILAQEPVKGYYDPSNDWFVYEFVSQTSGHRKIIHDSPNKVDPIVKANCYWDAKAEGYIFSYLILNGDKAKQLLDTIAIKFYSLIYDQSAPDKNWDMGEYRAGRTDTWEWSKTTGEPSGIPPGQVQGGFSFRSSGLPSIVDMFFWGERRVRYSLPYDDDPEEIRESFNRVAENLEAQYPDARKVITRKTLGPTAPPADLRPADFLDNIINMKHEAFSLGWIRNKGIEQSLDAKLNNAKKKLEQGNGNAAKNILSAFINEVEAQGCETYEDCPEGKHLTPEAYALLKYNVKYLIEHIK